MWIQETKIMRVHADADADPQHWFLFPIFSFSFPFFLLSYIFIPFSLPLFIFFPPKKDIRAKLIFFPQGGGGKVIFNK
jgi:hypothetical protein